jgi:hypothetical protein
LAFSVIEVTLSGDDFLKKWERERIFGERESERRGERVRHD